MSYRQTQGQSVRSQQQHTHMTDKPAPKPAAWRTLLVLLLLTHAAALNQNLVSVADDAARLSSGLARWQDSTEGVHSFLVFDYHLEDNLTHVQAIAPQYDYVWGASAKTTRAWRRGNPDIVVAQYMMWNLAGVDIKNLTWLKRNHPEWILYVNPCID